MSVRKFAVIDDYAVIEDADTLEELISQEKRIRKENPEILGDLIYVEIKQISH